MARTKSIAPTIEEAPVADVIPEVTPEVIPEVTPEVMPEVVPDPVPEVTVTINLNPAPASEPPLSAQTLAEMEAGRALIARFNGE